MHIVSIILSKYWADMFNMNEFIFFDWIPGLYSYMFNDISVHVYALYTLSKFPVVRYNFAQPFVIFIHQVTTKTNTDLLLIEYAGT